MRNSHDDLHSCLHNNLRHDDLSSHKLSSKSYPTKSNEHPLFGNNHIQHMFECLYVGTKQFLAIRKLELASNMRNVLIKQDL